jgi:uncharacterized membrane protein YdjX (TVP38/TMEM64 family)
MSCTFCRERSETRAPREDADDEAREIDVEQVANRTTHKLVTLLAIGAALFFVIHATPVGEHVRNWDALSETFTRHDPLAQLYFVLISSFLIMLGTPRLIFCGLAGFAFGFWQGLAWSLLASVLGSFLAFRAARWGGRQWLVAHFGKRRFFSRIVHAQPTVASVALIRMLPVANVVINLGLALSNVGNATFLAGSLLGFLPQGAIAVVIGSGLAQDVPWAGAAQFVIAGALVLALVVWRKRRKPG